jgi:predicted transcriptional regulator
MTRFTAWISKEERRRLKEKADRMGTSENLILRFAIRRYFNMEIPEEAESEDGSTRGRGTEEEDRSAGSKPAERSLPVAE